MIEVRTNLRVINTPELETSVKTVVMEMEADDALALATVLLNLDDDVLMVAPEWSHTFRKVSRLLIDAGNRVR